MLLATIALSVGCAPPKRPTEAPVTARAPDPPVEVRMWRDFSITLHGDVVFTPSGREDIVAAAEKWRNVTDGHARISLKFDFDFDSAENVSHHAAANDSVIVAIPENSDVVRGIDRRLGGPHRKPMAVTMPSQGPDDPTIVLLIMDRISDEAFVSVVTHELGHVMGLPDLPTLGSVMSGAVREGGPYVNAFTPDDLTLCHASLLCTRGPSLR